MRYSVIERAADTFQQVLPAPVVLAMCRRASRTDEVSAVTELPWGSYNNAYRVEFESGAAPVVLRVAPREARQFRVQARMMRNEYATTPFLAPIAELLPRIVFADFTHQLTDRDYLFETLVPGVPLPDAVGPKAGPEHAVVFEQIGAVARRIHTTVGTGFGPVAGPRFATWSEALVWQFETAAADVVRAGHDGSDLSAVAAAAERHSDVLDEITEPRLLHGDGWTGNFLVDADLTVTGVVDWDRAEWGDPLADWAIQRALQRPGTVRDAFWTGYGSPRTVANGPRQDFYHARFLLDCRLDMIRPGAVTDPAGIAANHAELAEVLARLR